MKENKHLWIVASVVLFIIGIEYLYTRSKGKKTFRFQNTVSNLLMGIFDRIAGIFMVPLIYYYYQYLYEYSSLFSIPKTWKEKGLLWLKGPDWVPESGTLKEMPLYIPKESYHYENFTIGKKIYIVLNVVFAFLGLLSFAFYLHLFNALQLALVEFF